MKLLKYWLSGLLYFNSNRLCQSSFELIHSHLKSIYVMRVHNGVIRKFQQEIAFDTMRLHNPSPAEILRFVV